MIRRGRVIAIIAAVAATTATATAASRPDGTPAPGARGQAAQAAPTQDPQRLEARVLRTYDAPDANQGVAVDGASFYAVDNTTITRHDRGSGAGQLRFAGAPDGPLIHLDSGAIEGDRLYASHSNYSQWPMESSIEVFDARTLQHRDTYSFGIDTGSITWLDRRGAGGSWWAGFANYDRVIDGRPYGGTENTQVVRLDGDLQIAERYTIPPAILDRFRPMSNSGGSWGPDGRLWLTGHDLGEAYVMEPPAAGSQLRWIATVTLPGVEGQGIAWDLTGPRPTLWAIKRSTHQVLQFDVPWRAIQPRPASVGTTARP